MGKITYETPRYLREIILDGACMVSARYHERDAVRMGMVYLGRVEAYHHQMKAYFVDLGSTKGIYQGTESLLIGKHYLFEVKKVQKGKHAILSRKVSLVGQYVVYRPDGPTEVSKHIGEKRRDFLFDQGLEHIYYKREAAEVSFHRVKEEAETLKALYETFLNTQHYTRKAKLLYTPKNVDHYQDQHHIMEIEEELFRLRQMVVFHEDIQFFLEMTKIGLVIDVNSARSKGDAGDINDVAIEFLSQLFITMNVGGLVLVDLIGGGEHRLFHDLMKVDSRITSVHLSKAGILEIIRKREGLNLFEIPLLEMLADLIEQSMARSEKPIKRIEVNEQFRGVEEYLPDIEINYGKIFGWFKLR